MKTTDGDAKKKTGNGMMEAGKQIFLERKPPSLPSVLLVVWSKGGGCP